MNPDQWLDFVVFTGMDKYKSEIAKLCKGSKKIRDNFYYMKLISRIYLGLESMLSDVKEIV